MWYITYNGVVTPHPYGTREDAIQALKDTFSDIQINLQDVAFWPNVSSQGNTRIEICKYDGEIE